MKIAFYTPQLDLRGSCNAVYNYANYNETLLFNKSVIVIPENSLYNEHAYFRFKNRFQILTYKSLEHLETIISDCDVLYCIKYGTFAQNNVLSKNIKTVIHCVFDMSEPHGHV